MYILLAGRASAELLLMLSEYISNDWYHIGIYLHLDIGPLDGIRDSAHFCIPRDKAFEMLKLWLKGNGDNATVEVLAEALGKAKRQDLIHWLQTQVEYTAAVIRICRIPCMAMNAIDAKVFSTKSII